MSCATRWLSVALLALVASCGGGGGGGGSSDSPVATPSPASRPLQLAISWPSDVIDHRAIALVASGGDGKLSWSVECGTGLSCTIANGILEMASRAEGGLARVQITLTVTDGSGARASASKTVSAWPKLMTASLHTLTGATDRPGPQLLIIADGFTEDEAAFVTGTASAILDSMFSHPEIAAHRSAWNVHVARMPTYVDPATGLAEPSRLGMQTCPGYVSVLYCLNVSQARWFAARYLPNYTDVLVLANSTTLGGLTLDGVAAVTRYWATATAAVHELGHAFAGLGDEYVVPGASSASRPPPDYPNITQFTDLERIPWKHWIEPGTPIPTFTITDQKAVGLYEGAYYSGAGYYRPTLDSFMRGDSGNGVVGPVNGEAWALQVYAKGGAWARKSPATGPVLDQQARPADGWRFQAEPLMDRTICETRLYVNGIERADQRGASELRLTDAGALRVRVDLVDLTRRIRKNQGVASTLTWTVQ